MKNAIEKIDRFLERYKQLCLEEGLFIDDTDNDLTALEFINPNHMESMEDSIDMIRNMTIEGVQYHKKWKELDSDKAGPD